MYVNPTFPVGVFFCPKEGRYGENIPKGVWPTLESLGSFCVSMPEIKLKMGKSIWFLLPSLESRWMISHQR